MHFAAQNAGLDSRADGNALIRVDALEGFFADEVLNRFLNSRDTGGTADQQHLV